MSPLPTTEPEPIAQRASGPGQIEGPVGGDGHDPVRLRAGKGRVDGLELSLNLSAQERERRVKARCQCHRGVTGRIIVDGDGVRGRAHPEHNVDSGYHPALSTSALNVMRNTRSGFDPETRTGTAMKRLKEMHHRIAAIRNLFATSPFGKR